VCVSPHAVSGGYTVAVYIWLNIYVRRDLQRFGFSKCRRQTTPPRVFIFKQRKDNITMARFFLFTTVLALISLVHAQCGAGTPDARVTGSGSSFTATRGSSTVYSGSDYRAAIQAAVDSISSGQRVSVIASGSIGANTITIGSGKTFEGCGTINVGNRGGRGAIEVLNTVGTKIPYLTMTGNPYFGLRFYGTRDLVLGQITMNLSGGCKWS